MSTTNDRDTTRTVRRGRRAALAVAVRSVLEAAATRAAAGPAELRHAPAAVRNLADWVGQER